MRAAGECPARHRLGPLTPPRAVRMLEVRMRQPRLARPDSGSLLLTLLLVTVAAGSQPAAPAKPAASSSAPAAAPAATQAPPAPAPAQSAPAQSATAGTPVEIRIGHGFAAEENLWLMAAKPDLTPNQGKAYTLAFTAFRGNTDRLNAYEAGQLDGGTVAAPTALFAAEEKLPFKLVASIVREQQGAFNTTYLAIDESGIRSAADVRGKTVGVVDFKSATE